MAEQPKYFYLNLQCAGITGNCQKQAHLKWLEVDSWSFSISQQAAPVVGGGSPKGSKATGTFIFTQKHAGPQVFKNVASAAHIAGPAEFDAERGGINQGSAVGTSPTKPYLVLNFSDFAIVGRSLGGDSGQKSETITLAFSTVSLGYAQVVNGVMQGLVTKTYQQKDNSVS
jgi:type VI protein secretion system component Hcp